MIGFPWRLGSINIVHFMKLSYHLFKKWQRRFFILYEHGLLRYALDEMSKDGHLSSLASLPPTSEMRRCPPGSSGPRFMTRASNQTQMHCGPNLWMWLREKGKGLPVEVYLWRSTCGGLPVEVYLWSSTQAARMENVLIPGIPKLWAEGGRPQRGCHTPGLLLSAFRNRCAAARHAGRSRMSVNK
ncbi:Myosin phosphatase Rho-interacting protein [Liparis tanakae]|uniref:Myosin phosphatase Rho-interacting protein n=1 Tax=Liparis tanakae TaxID=230148 RepID=A0A4Z2FBA2_9TELE|nr:Myosin phosphatase Rho-interacting protein [Liparis tanakae]